MNVRLVVLIAPVLLLAACPKQVTAPPPDVEAEAPMPPPIRVPPGCEAPVEGAFAHAQNAAYRYRAQDDGGTLLLFVERPMSDGGLPADDAGTVISLKRMPDGFHGETAALVFTQRGARCRVSFPTELAACTDGGLLLRSASTGTVDETCRAPSSAPPSPRLEHQLLRIVESASDAGAPESVPDAGKPFGADGG